MSDTSHNGWIKLMRSQEAHELARDAAALGLLGIIAMRARWRTGFNIHGLKPGEALMGDHDAIGLSRQVYRTHLANLQKWGFVTTKATNKGTIVTLTGRAIFDINEEPTNQQVNQTITNGQPTANQPATTNKEGKKEKKGTIPETSSSTTTSPPQPHAVGGEEKIGVSDELLTPGEIWFRTCQALGRSMERPRSESEDGALLRCSTWLTGADLQLLEAYERRLSTIPKHRSMTAYTFLHHAAARLRDIKARTATPQAGVGQPAQTPTAQSRATDGQASLNGHKRPTVDEVFAFISKAKWPVEVARAYINARTRTDPPWHLPETNDRPARPISADWHADVNLFLKNWNEVEEKKAERRDRDEELF